MPDDSSRVDIREDRLIITVPDARHFRLEDAPTFNAVKAHSLTEADFAWMIDGSDTLWLMELKDYGANRPSVAKAEQKLRTTLPKNLAHAFLMISAVWADTPFGRKLRQDIEATFPDFPKEATSVRAIAVIHAEGIDPAPFAALNSAVQAALSAFEFDQVSVLPASSDRIETHMGIRIQYAPE